jgi:hypothetical protein
MNPDGFELAINKVWTFIIDRSVIIIIFFSRSRNPKTVAGWPDEPTRTVSTWTGSYTITFIRPFKDLKVCFVFSSNFPDLDQLFYFMDGRGLPYYDHRAYSLCYSKL